MTTPEPLQVERDGAIAVVTLSSPTMAPAFFAACERVFGELGDDAELRAIVVRGGAKCFSYGLDLVQAFGEWGTILAGGGLAKSRTELFALIKKLQRSFNAIAACPVPVIAAVHGFCVGGGIGLVGNADVIVASDDAYFGLPEVDRGALGAATHLSRLVPQHKMRAMVYTSATATAAELHAFGSVLKVVARDELRDAAFEVARSIAAKSPTVIRAAKESLNGIDLWDVKRSYRFEQGFTFELNLSGVSDELRDAFVEGRDADTST
jgi:enoyl-CoA hydratase